MAGCTGLGGYYSLLYLRRVGTLFYCRKGMMILRGEIAYGRVPISQALLQAAHRVNGAMAKFFLCLSKELENGAGDMPTVFYRTLQQTVTERDMKQADKKELLELGDTLGYLDVEMQLSAIDLYLQRLEQSMREYEKEKKNRTRLYPVLGMMGGILLCMVIL